jgi:glutamate 5-kinase
VVNENDTVATAEIRFGDNDRLAARVAAMIGADLLILLSDVDGLYTGNPNQNNDAAHLPQIDHITDDIMAMAGAANAQYASGGMVTKLAAARIALDAGCALAIADGRRTNPVATLATVNDGTWFIGEETPQQARKRWINGALKVEGAVHIDAGAVKALHQGKSLLPAGTVKVIGAFERGATVKIIGPDDREIARGLIAYEANDARKIAGKQSAAIEAELGYRGRAALIHRDDLSLTGRSETQLERKEASK